MNKLNPSRQKWKGTMTDRERFNNQMHYRPVDRCFNMEMGYWPENFQQWSIFKNNGITDDRQANEFFNFDRIDYENGNVWLNPLFPEGVVEQTEDRKVIMDKHGALAEVPKDGHSGIPCFTKPAVITPNHWRKVKQERLRIDDPARKVDIDALKKAHPSDRDYPFGIDLGSMIGRVRNLLTFEGLAYACYDYPDMVEDMVETCCLLVEDLLDQILGKLDFDYASGWEDICFKNGPIVTVDFFRSVVVPRYKRLYAKLKAHDIDIWFIDCDGDIRPLIPCFLEGGVNIMYPLEVAASGHPGPILDEYGPELRIMGGVDKLMFRQGPKAMRKYLQSLVPYVERGGFIPFCDHLCPPDVKEQDYLHYLDMKEELFG